MNERIEQIDKLTEKLNRGSEPPLFEFLCECGHGETGCDDRLQMTIEEYERVRSQDDRFAVRPGHELDEIEWVAERNERFVVVDKRRLVEALVEDDPRGAPSG